MIYSSVNLKSLNSFGVEVVTNQFGTFKNIEELRALLKEKGDSELLILGGGSNLLFTKNFNGLVIKNEIKGIDIVQEDDNRIIVKAGAGENWHEFVLKCIENNWGGIENLSLIPGNVGASPMQNIGAYGVEIKDVFHELEAFHIESGTIKLFKHQECNFGYRESVFKNTMKGQYIILNVSFELTKKNHQIKTSYGDILNELKRNEISLPTIKDVSNAIIAIRKSKLPDPKELGNAGSFFKNPIIEKSEFENLQKKHPKIPHYVINENQVKVPAGWLIEQAGWKGKKFNNFGVHNKQALVLVNYGGASGIEIYNLSTEILNDIQNKFNIKLEREVNII